MISRLRWRRAHAAALVALLVVALVPRGAWAAGKKKRTIAVLEYRSGASAVPDLGVRLALMLRNGTSHEIIDPDDARRVTGDKIDDWVAKCGGEAKCIGELGRKLDADEVLLVGVSELGDVILAIQRVQARGGKAGKVTGRVADSFDAAAEPDDATLEGYLRKLLPPGDFLRYGTIRVKTNVAGATVHLNGVAKGKTPLDPVTVEAPAKIDLRVSKAGYVDFTARLDVLPEGTVEVTPVLTKRLGTAWYGKWWVWAIAGTVAVGAVATAVVLSQPDPSSVDVFVDF